jgi:hypothetical protein
MVPIRPSVTSGTSLPSLDSFFSRNFEKACSSTVEDANVWKHLKGSHLFLTGGTGFFGSWLLRLIKWANENWGCGIRVSILSRDPKAFLAKRPEFKLEVQNEKWIELLTGDIRNFTFPSRETEFNRRECQTEHRKPAVDA